MYVGAETEGQGVVSLSSDNWAECTALNTARWPTDWPSVRLTTGWSAAEGGWGADDIGPCTVTSTEASAGRHHRSRRRISGRATDVAPTECVGATQLHAAQIVIMRCRRRNARRCTCSGARGTAMPLAQSHAAAPALTATTSIYTRAKYGCTINAAPLCRLQQTR